MLAYFNFPRTLLCEGGDPGTIWYKTTVSRGVPIIPEQGLTMIHAPRGIGKTHALPVMKERLVKIVHSAETKIGQ